MSALARIALALLRAGGDRQNAADYAQAQWGMDTTEYRALGSALSSEGGVLVGTETSLQFASALRSISVVRRLGARSIPLMGQQATPKVTGGAELSYIGDNQIIPVSEQSLGLVQFNLRTLAALVPVSGPIMRHAPELAERLIITDLLEGAAAAEDSQFLRGPGTEYQPKGARYWAHADNVLTSAGATFDNVLTDLGAAMAAIEDKKVPMRRPGWALSHRTRRFLSTLKDTAGSLAFKDELAAGTLLGYPFASTTGIPDDLGAGSDESEVFFADWAETAIGEGFMSVDVAKGAAYFQSGTIRAGYSSDTWAIRIIVEHDFNVRHEEAVAVLTGVTWGS